VLGANDKDVAAVFATLRPRDPVSQNRWNSWQKRAMRRAGSKGCLSRHDGSLKPTFVENQRAESRSSANGSR
jgi:hypothetical protein